MIFALVDWAIWVLLFYAIFSKMFAKGTTVKEVNNSRITSTAIFAVISFLLTILFYYESGVSITGVVLKVLAGLLGLAIGLLIFFVLLLLIVCLVIKSSVDKTINNMNNSESNENNNNFTSNNNKDDIIDAEVVDHKEEDDQQ